jgi:predicted glycosyltransferase
MKPALLLYCQHSVGMGHLTRSFALAQALARDFRVVFLNGGPFPPGLHAPAGVEVIDLPPLGMLDGHDLVSRDARFSVAEARALRRRRVLGALADTEPRIILVELFPFGRKKFAFELLPLLKAARRGARPPLVICSLRDILVNARPDKQHHDDRARWLADRYFDAVLVHADPRFARLEESFRPRRALAAPVFYTGFAPPQRVVAGSVPRGDHVLVSAGGGMAGAPLFRAALAAHDLLAPRERPPMRLVAGPFLPEDDWRDLVRAGEGREDFELVRAVPDMHAEMQRAAVSVSQCGYNTALDIVASGVPALVVPFAEGLEDEQTNRARRLEALQLLKVLPPSLLDGTRLAREMLAMLGFTPRPAGLELDGAANTARIVGELLAARPRPAPRKASFAGRSAVEA